MPRVATDSAMRRGDIRVVDLNPATGSQADKRRPAVIVSNDGANATAVQLGRGVVTVVPITSNVERVYPFQVLLPAADVGLRADSKAQAEQIRSIDVRRIGDRVGVLTSELLAELDDAMRTHLGL
jgi:mRNA interferase MazF